MESALCWGGAAPLLCRDSWSQFLHRKLQPHFSHTNQESVAFESMLSRI